MMTVKELIKKLQKWSPDSFVCLEVRDDPMANVVQEYKKSKTGRTVVYVADNLENLEEDLLEGGYEKL